MTENTKKSPEELAAEKAAKAEAKAAEKAAKDAEKAAKKAEKEAAKAAKVAAKPAKIEQNGVSRPAAGTATGRVWEIADSLSSKAGKPAPRKDVLEVTKAEGINDATAATQYGRWRKFNGLEGSGKAE